MTAETIQRWLKKKNASYIFLCWVGSVLALLSGAVVLFLTFWFTYVVIFIGEGGVSAVRELCFNHKFHLGHFWRMIISGLFLAALFIEWLRRSPGDLGNYGRVDSPMGARALMYYDGGLGSIATLLANPQTSASIITEILYTGPRLVMGCGSLAREAYRSRTFDPDGCAWILALLVARGKGMTYDEMDAVGQEIDWPKYQADLTRIPGVVFLENGLSITSELRTELCSLAT